ncbi:hypothetical protein BDW74DRAFT_159060 [Aspergillus multicolor]|uniref:uncharacterized protein n=1 Tax=Aspergillus multicolor TaxID=41759 RepID=UPI003CCDAC46
MSKPRTKAAITRYSSARASSTPRHLRPPLPNAIWDARRSFPASPSQRWGSKT